MVITMTDGRLPNDVDEKLEELGERAQEAYDQDPHGETVAYLQSVVSDLESLDEPEAFVDGYRYAEYHASKLYVEHSREFWCECRAPERFAAVIDGMWVCEYCGVEIVERGKEVADGDHDG